MANFFRISINLLLYIYLAVVGSAKRPSCRDISVSDALTEWNTLYFETPTIDRQFIYWPRSFPRISSYGTIKSFCVAPIFPIFYHPTHSCKCLHGRMHCGNTISTPIRGVVDPGWSYLETSYLCFRHCSCDDRDLKTGLETIMPSSSGSQSSKIPKQGPKNLNTHLPCKELKADTSSRIRIRRINVPATAAAAISKTIWTVFKLFFKSTVLLRPLPESRILRRWL
jgi:hypothetical protein